MSLKFLIVHESIIIRNIIRKYIAADYGQAAVDLCISSEKALPLLKTEKYDAVLSGMEMSGMDGFDLFAYMQTSAVNCETPMIIMTSADMDERSNRLNKQCNQYILPIPCNFAQFRTLMYEVFHPEISDTRRNIPKPGALIRADHHIIPADIIRIAENSLVCEPACGDCPDCLTKASEITVGFSADYGRSGMIHLTGDLPEQIAAFEIADEFSEQKRLRIIWKVRWKYIELTRAVHKPVKISLTKDSEYCLDEKTENISLAKENENLKIATEALRAEKDDLLHEIAELRKRLSELGKIASETVINRIPTNALIGEVVRRSDDPAKLSMFRQLIDENIKLRKGE